MAAVLPSTATIFVTRIWSRIPSSMVQPLNYGYLSRRNSNVRFRWAVDLPGIRSPSCFDNGNRDGGVASEGEEEPPNQMGNRRSFGGRRPLWKRVLFGSKKVRSIIMLNVLNIIYASNILVIKEIEVVMDPAFFNMIRFAVCAIPFLPFVIRAREDDKIRTSGLELGCWVSFGYLAQALGLVTSDAGRASFLSAFTVIVVPLIDGFFGSNISALTWMSTSASLIGVAMLESSGSSPNVGDLLHLLSAVFFGIYILRAEQISRVTKKDKVFALLGYEVSVVALFSAIWYLSKGVFHDMDQFKLGSWYWEATWDWVFSFPWIPALYTGVFSTGLCSWAEMCAMNDVSATETAIIFGMEPLWGASFAWFLLGERWDVYGWLGAALILGGSLSVQIFELAPKKCEGAQEWNKPMHQMNVDKTNGFVPATVVSSQKELRNLVKKHDKL